MAKSLLFTLGLVLAVGTVQASPNKYTTNTEEGNFKYGFQAGVSILHQRVGGFVEYKVHQKLGIQSGLFLTADYALVKDLEKKWAAVETGHVTLPLTFCCYPGKDRQSCLFGGGELGYLVVGEVITIKIAQNPVDIRELMQKMLGNSNPIIPEKEDITQRPDKRNLAFRLALGYSYEFKFGLLLGMRYMRGLNSVIQAEETFLNWSLHVHAGWNLAPLIALLNS